MLIIRGDRTWLLFLGPFALLTEGPLVTLTERPFTSFTEGPFASLTEGSMSLSTQWSLNAVVSQRSGLSARRAVAQRRSRGLVNTYRTRIRVMVPSLLVKIHSLPDNGNGVFKMELPILWRQSTLPVLASIPNNKPFLVLTHSVPSFSNGIAGLCS